MKPAAYEVQEAPIYLPHQEDGSKHLMSLEEVVDVGSGMASSHAGITFTALQKWNKFVGVLVVP